MAIKKAEAKAKAEVKADAVAREVIGNL